VSQIRNEKVCSAVADLRFCGLPVANSQHWKLPMILFGKDPNAPVAPLVKGQEGMLRYIPPLSGGPGH